MSTYSAWSLQALVPKTYMNFYSMRAIRPANLVPRDIVTLKKFGEEYKLRRSLLLRPPS